MKLIVVATSAVVLLVCHAMLADAECDAATITKCSTDFGTGIAEKKALCPLYTKFNKCLTDLTCGDAMKDALDTAKKVQSDLYGEKCSGASHVSFAAVLLAGSLLLVKLFN